MSYHLAKTVSLYFNEVIGRGTAALKHEGFSILTDIVIQATLKSKLGADVPNYRILGACNPSFAHQALQLENKLGALLPCNVMVREERPGLTEVDDMSRQRKSLCRRRRGSHAFAARCR